MKKSPDRVTFNDGIGAVIKLINKEIQNLENMVQMDLKSELANEILEKSIFRKAALLDFRELLFKMFKEDGN